MKKIFIVDGALVIMAVKKMITRMRKNNYLHWQLLPFNGLQDGAPYAGYTVGNSPKFIPLYGGINIGIFHSLYFHFVLSRFVLKVEGDYGEEKKAI